ncbi:hypothetical protein F511_08433 [Dorcoceras hygrometricum]|uniref:Uncharacterized protein n=1 Tax=Dorcoceras hygrometricum TaxID=472368 RepID=A0A2Z7CPY0_9LAMI|nr:hypothetical protein F511_08433 [Dorcoceras hygrometricum]
MGATPFSVSDLSFSGYSAGRGVDSAGGAQEVVRLVFVCLCVVQVFQVTQLVVVLTQLESTRSILGKCVYLVTLAMSLFDLQDVCIAIGSIATLDSPMVVDLIGIYGLRGPYCTLTTTEWFLQALSVIPRGSWGDVARRFTMIRWAVDRSYLIGDRSYDEVAAIDIVIWTRARWTGPSPSLSLFNGLNDFIKHDYIHNPIPSYSSRLPLFPTHAAAVRRPPPLAAVATSPETVPA